MAQKMRVTYLDGTETEVVASPKAQVMAERYLRSQGGFENSTIVEASIRLAFEASKPGIGNIGYEEWLDKIADVDLLCPKCGALLGDDPDAHKCAVSEDGSGDRSGDPTPEGPSPTPSFA